MTILCVYVHSSHFDNNFMRLYNQNFHYILCVNCACLISMLHSTIYVFVLFDINVVRQFCVLHCLYDFANKILSLFVVLIIIKDINLCYVLHDIHLTRQFYVKFLC
jgi:hypothetical protein